MNRIDRLHLELPFVGARMLRYLLRQEGHKVGRSKVGRLMRLMGSLVITRCSARSLKPDRCLTCCTALVIYTVARP